MFRITPWMFPMALLLSVVFLDGAHAVAAADDWLPIAPEDLALKDNPKSPGADAMILYRESIINAGNSSLTEYLRIKIFTTKGEQNGDVSIPYEATHSAINALRARTIRPNGEIVEFEGTVFDKTVMRGTGFNFVSKTFSLPEVEPGSIIEYRYVHQFEHGHHVDLTWNLQGTLFTRTARFSILSDKSAGTPALYFRAMNLPEGTGSPQQQQDGSYNMEIHDLPGIEQETYMPPDSTVRGRVEFFYRNPLLAASANAEQFWKNLAKALGTRVEMFVDKKGMLASEVARVCGPSDSEDTKLRKLYARAREIRNLSYENARTKKEQDQENLKPNLNVEDLLKHGYGDRGQINLLFVGLARAAGFEAAQFYVAPRDRTFFSPELQDPRQLSSQIAWVRAGGKEYYLDPGAQYYPFGVLPWPETGTKGLRAGANDGEIVTIPMPPASGTGLNRHTNLKMDDDGVLTGTMQVRFEGQEAAVMREGQRGDDEAGRRKKFEEGIKQWLPPGTKFGVTKISNWADVGLPVQVEGTLEVPGLTTQTRQRKIMPSSLFQPPQARAFQSAKRVNPVYFHFPSEVVDEIKIQISAGYRAEILPQPQQISAGEFSYAISASQDKDVVEVRRRVTVNAVSVPAQRYASLRTFFVAVKSNDEAQIVLQRTDVAKKN
jgi:hypothetical protein